MFKPVSIVLLFCLSVGWLYFLVTSAADYFPKLSQQQHDELMKFPSSLDDLKALSGMLSGLLADDLGSIYVLVLFASAYLFKQTFAIPGSVFLNALAGALFGLGVGFSLACILTATGATFCYLLARYAGRQAAFRYFPQKLEKFSNLLEENRSRLPYLLLSLRLFPISPNWAVNMCCGVLNVPITTFFLTVLVGLMPYNYTCVTTGVILSKVTSMSDIFTWTTMFQMSGVAVMAFLPALIMKDKNK